MKKSRSFWKMVAFDTLAGLCFIGVILFGWLPGPGGVPLFLLGLSLLAANHEWAERWLETAKHKGVSFKKRLFPKAAWIRNLYDIVATALVAGGIYSLFQTSNRLLEGAIVIVICVSLFVLLLNRDRLDAIQAYFKKKHHSGKA
jgi:hypothetical protein